MGLEICTLITPLLLFGAPAAAVPVILDTDIGDDIDDTWALGLLLGRPEVEVKLVVTDYGNTPEKTRLVAKILDTLGRTDVPIGMGVKTNDKAINQRAWLEGYDLASYKGTIHEDGVQALIDTINAAPAPITLLTIGPVPNIKAALERDPGIAKKARVVAMAGSVYQGYGEAPKPACPEWNVRADVASYRALFAAPWPVTITPLDGCGQMILRGERYARVANSDAPLARTVIENYNAWTHRSRHPADASSVLFDTVAIYLAFNELGFAESFCEMKDLKLSITDDGKTVPDDNGRPVRCHLGWKDRDAFEELLVNALTEPAG